MDIKQIQDLIRFVSKSGVNEVSIEQENFKITIKTNDAPTYVNATVPAAAPLAAASAPQPTALPVSAPVTTIADTTEYITIKSPMIGTFYRSASPEKPLFVNVGDEITPGSVLCIIEAMKVMNEIKAEASGVITRILVDDATPVQFETPLFEIKPG